MTGATAAAVRGDKGANGEGSAGTAPGGFTSKNVAPGKRVGIITISAQSLTPRHLEAAGVPPDTPIVGTEHGREFFRVLILGEKPDMDIGLAAADILEAGRTLVAGHPDIGAIVLECTNMPPYAFALREVLGLPVYDVYSLVTWLHAGLRPREFGAPADRATCFGGG